MSQPHADDFSDAKYEPRLDGEAFRADLHSYVFVYGDALLVDTLVNRSWNKALKAPLRVLREKNGQPMVVSDYTMNIFRSAIRQLDFQICEGHPALDEVQEGDEVMVVDGPMKGGEGWSTSDCATRRPADCCATMSSRTSRSNWHACSSTAMASTAPWNSTRPTDGSWSS